MKSKLDELSDNFTRYIVLILGDQLESYTSNVIRLCNFENQQRVHKNVLQKMSM